MEIREEIDYRINTYKSFIGKYEAELAAAENIENSTERNIELQHHRNMINIYREKIEELQWVLALIEENHE